MSTLWHGRFEGGPSDALLAFTVSLPYDQVLAGDDLDGSRAHVRGLVRAGVLSVAEADRVLAALDQVGGELATGAFEFVPSDEDIHTAVERRVTEIAGSVGAKLHTGRSRNDQVATDLRLFTKRELLAVVDRVVDLQQVLVDQARASGDAYLPGYTHLQRAQPVLLAHHLLAHGWALARDVDRLLDCRRRLDVSPLGAGALAGSSLALDPEGVAADLGFAEVFDNSLDAVSDRDFVAEAVFALTLVGIHLSRLGEEIVLWSTAEFGFLHLSDEYSTGSSMLPQKKNPDIAELARGKAGRLIGNLTGLLATLKGLPLAYNRDLQEDKEPLFDTLGQVTLALAALSGLLASSRFDPTAMAAAADGPEVAATDLAEHLVSAGMPFRDAYVLVGALVRRSLDEGVPLADLVAAEPRLGPAAVDLLAPGVAVRRRTTRGGAGPGPVADQLGRFDARLATDRTRRAEAGGLSDPAMGFHHEVSVRYGEVDQQGVVFNAHYLAWIDDAMDRWMRSLDPDFESSGWDYMVRHAVLEWLDGARLGDTVALDAEVSRWGTTSFVVHHRLHVGERTVVLADMTYVGVDRHDHRPVPPPAAVRRHLGEPRADAGS